MALSEDSNFPPRPFHRFIILYIFIFILKTHSSFQLIPFITLIFWQYIFSPEINQCSVSSSITFGRCHATSINTRRMLASQWLITFWSFGKSLEREAIIVKTFFSQWLCKIFWEENLLLPACILGRAYDRHPVWWPLIHQLYISYFENKNQQWNYIQGCFSWHLPETVKSPKDLDFVCSCLQIEATFKARPSLF